MLLALNWNSLSISTRPKALGFLGVAVFAPSVPPTTFLCVFVLFFLAIERRLVGSARGLNADRRWLENVNKMCLSSLTSKIQKLTREGRIK